MSYVSCIVMCEYIRDSLSDMRAVSLVVIFFNRVIFKRSIVSIESSILSWTSVTVGDGETNRVARALCCDLFFESFKVSEPNTNISKKVLSILLLILWVLTGPQREKFGLGRKTLKGPYWR